MAKKTRKQKQRAAVRRSPTAPAPGRAASPTAPAGSAAPLLSEPLPDMLIASESVSAVDVSATQPAAAGVRRRVERVTPAAPGRIARPSRGPVNAAAMFQPLDGDDAAIPFDRVPYVPRDLRRVAIMAGLMIVLIIIAAVVVGRIVT